MAGVHGGVLDQPALNISTELGLLTMAAEPSLVKMVRGARACAASS